MDRDLEEQVWLRAKFRCEYCHFPHTFAEYPFHTDHIIARKHRGKSTAENLALACFFCSTCKGSNIAGLDPLTEKLTPLFHPRKDIWSDHFRWDEAYLLGLTPVGRTTVEVLRINEADALNIRRLLIAEGFYPL